MSWTHLATLEMKHLHVALCPPRSLSHTVRVRSIGPNAELNRTRSLSVDTQVHGTTAYVRINTLDTREASKRERNDFSIFVIGRILNQTKKHATRPISNARKVIVTSFLVAVS